VCVNTRGQDISIISIAPLCLFIPFIACLQTHTVLVRECAGTHTRQNVGKHMIGVLAEDVCEHVTVLWTH
jgi:hypothetical protein